MSDTENKPSETQAPVESAPQEKASLWPKTSQQKAREAYSKASAAQAAPTPVQETKAVETSPAPEEISIDSLLDKHFDNTKEGDLAKKLHADYTRKTQELAKQKKQIEEIERIRLSNEAKLREQLELPEDVDIYTPEGLRKYTESVVAKALLEAQKPVKEAMEMQAVREDIESFKSANPDISNYKKEILDIMKTYNAKGKELDLKEAYFIVKGQKANDILKQKELELAEYKKAKMDSLKKIGSGITQTPTGKPKSAREAYAQIMKARG